MPKSIPSDQVYAQARTQVGDFVFDEAVSQVFPNMIRRSVPGYTTLLEMIGVIASRYAQPNSNIYDLGCSWGEGLRMMQPHLAGSTQLIGVDKSASMIEHCQSLISSTPQIQLLCADILDIKIENASIVVLNLTLQFIPRADRLDFLRYIKQNLLPQGVLILSEKVHFDDVEKQAEWQTLYYDFKRQNGYSELEIQQKHQALEHVLRTDSLETHQARLQTAGFQRQEVWFQCLNFTSLLAWA
jgi:tRNA (cmo5U34)-methyltransferase